MLLWTPEPNAIHVHSSSFKTAFPLTCQNFCDFLWSRNEHDGYNGYCKISLWHDNAFRSTTNMSWLIRCFYPLLADVKVKPIRNVRLICILSLLFLNRKTATYHERKLDKLDLKYNSVTCWRGQNRRTDMNRCLLLTPQDKIRQLVLVCSSILSLWKSCGVIL